MIIFFKPITKNLLVRSYFFIKNQVSKSLPTFKNYNFHPKIYQYLQKKQYHTPSSIQTKFYQSILTAQNYNYYMIGPTGSGKTLAYLLPLFNFLKRQQQIQQTILTKKNRPRCIIIVSSKQLVIQVSDICKQISHYIKIKVCGINAGNQKKYQIKKLDQGIDILITTMDKLQNLRQHIHLSYLSYLIIDQFDTLLDADYGEKLNLLIQSIKIRQIRCQDMNKKNTPKLIFVSATYTKNMDLFFKKCFDYYQRHIGFYSKNQLQRMDSFKNIEAKEFQLKKIIDTNTHLNLQNIKHQFIHCKELDKHQPLYALLKQQKNKISDGSVMIFCNTITSLNNLQYYLNQNKINVVSLHGNLPKKIRLDNYHKFRDRVAHIILATDLGSRGLDFDFVTHVINYDFPKSISDYLHRAGRTGRAGKSGFVFTLYHNKNLDIINELKASYDSNKPLTIKNSAYSLRNKQDLQKLYKRRKLATKRIKK